jgi:uncharacterized membrane protein
VEESSFVPYVAVNLGVLLALASLAVLIFFIHHVSQSIQAETLIAEVGDDFQKALPVLFPERIGQPRNLSASTCTVPDDKRWQSARVVKSCAAGYLQRVDDEQLLHIATQHDLILKLEKRPGDFVADASPLVRVLPISSLNDSIEERLRGCFCLGRHRTPHQDALYMVQQLVEIAAHALSPGINEPFTALICIDWLGASLRGVAQREIPNPLRQDENGHLRVVAVALDFKAMAHTAFDQIRIYGASNPDIMLRLLQVIAEIAPDLHRESDREVLIQHARLIEADAGQIHNESDRLRIAACFEETLCALAQNGEQQAREQ